MSDCISIKQLCDMEEQVIAGTGPISKDDYIATLVILLRQLTGNTKPPAEESPCSTK